MKNYLKKDRGIMLIALVITIVLIIVAVSIIIGLSDTTEKNTQDHKVAQDAELEIDSGKVNRVGTVYDGIEQEIEVILPEINEGERAKDGNATYKGVTIPKGFTVSKIPGEYEDVKNGLVIYDIPEEDLKDSTKVDWTNSDTVKTKYNQFVWIPVKVNKTTDTPTSITSFYISNWVDSIDGGTRNEDILNFYTEPYALDDSDYDGTDGTGIRKQIAELTESIYKHEGFYIGRYEAGTTMARINGSSQTTPFVIQQDKYPYNYVMWGASMGNISTGGAVYLSNNLYPSTNSNYGAASMLCTGACWDAVLDFVKDNKHNVTNSVGWGNYYYSETYRIYRGSYYTSSTWTPSDTRNGTEITKDITKDIEILLTTGATERNSSKNIYDIAGNCSEWTTEAAFNFERVLRGGGCNWTYDGTAEPASFRVGGFPDEVDDGSSYISFRPILYVK